MKARRPPGSPAPNLNPEDEFNSEIPQNPPACMHDLQVCALYTDAWKMAIVGLTKPRWHLTRKKLITLVHQKRWNFVLVVFLLLYIAAGLWLSPVATIFSPLATVPSTENAEDAFDISRTCLTTPAGTPLKASVSVSKLIPCPSNCCHKRTILVHLLPS